MPTAIITLTTDFGLEDHYVGTMKGVLLSRCPHAQLVDLSHQIPAFSVCSAAYTLAQAAPYFPAGTVHLAVIDPGVGSSRKPLLAVVNDQLFIAPDNGLLSLVLAAARPTGQPAEVRELSNSALWLAAPSATFHGRDIFAPVAGALAAGIVGPPDVGPIINDVVRLPGLEPSLGAPNLWLGLVLSVDHFGNVITSFPSRFFAPKLATPFLLKAGSGDVTTFRSNFSGAPPGVCFVYAGSSGYLELGINQEHAGRVLSLHPGESLKLQVAD